MKRWSMIAALVCAGCGAPSSFGIYFEVRESRTMWAESAGGTVSATGTAELLPRVLEDAGETELRLFSARFSRGGSNYYDLVELSDVTTEPPTPLVVYAGDPQVITVTWSTPLASSAELCSGDTRFSFYDASSDVLAEARVWLNEGTIVPSCY